MTERVDTLEIPRPAAAALDALARSHAPDETGGILVGTIAEDTATVTALIGAGPAAEHRSHSFDPDQDWQLATMADVWASAGADWRYLGDWHSHPASRLRPSVRDWKVARLIASSNDACCPAPVMVIVGAGPRPRVGVFQLRRGWFRRVAVRMVDRPAVLRP